MPNDTKRCSACKQVKSKGHASARSRSRAAQQREEHRLANAWLLVMRALARSHRVVREIREAQAS